MNKLFALVLAAMLAGCTSAPRLPPLSDSGVSLPGKFVWRDLVTPDPATAESFYGPLFGWQFEPVADSGYSLIRHDGVLIGGVVDANKIGQPVRSAVWVNAMSVPDIKSAVRAVRDAGGRIIRKPHALPARGKVAVAVDADGAVFQLIESFGGDPVDTEPQLNQFLWVEMISNDPDGAVDFYQRVIGYDIETLETSGAKASYRLLLRDGTPRGGILDNPFEDTRSAWVPYIRVEDIRVASAKVGELGGRVVVEPREDLRKGTVALILDPSGAPLALQEWSPGKEVTSHE